MRYYPYVPIDSHLDVSTHADIVSQQCGSRLVRFNPGEAVTFDSGYKYVIHMTLPPFSMSNEPRKNVMNYYGKSLRTFRHFQNLTYN
jgi:hypothetical protein